MAGCILSLVDAVRTGGEPSYGPQQARLDQEITLAIRASSAQGGAPVTLPLERLGHDDNYKDYTMRNSSCYLSHSARLSAMLYRVAIRSRAGIVYESISRAHFDHLCHCRFRLLQPV